MNHFSSLRKVLDEAIETPHQIVGHPVNYLFYYLFIYLLLLFVPVEAAALPVNQHGGKHVSLSVNLLQHEVVNLGVAVDQSLELGQGFLLL